MRWLSQQLRVGIVTSLTQVIASPLTMTISATSPLRLATTALISLKRQDSNIWDLVLLANQAITESVGDAITLTYSVDDTFNPAVESNPLMLMLLIHLSILPKAPTSKPLMC